MIEVARALVKSKCKLKYSIIFVAFDKEEVAIMMIVMVVVFEMRCLQFCYGRGGQSRQEELIMM